MESFPLGSPGALQNYGSDLASSLFDWHDVRTSDNASGHLTPQLLSSLKNQTHSLEGGSDLLYDVPVYLVVVLSIAYGAVSLAAVVGNGAVLWFVVRQQRLRNVTNLFIANLSIADILIGAFAIPFQFLAALLQRWILPNFMCAFCSFVQIVSVNVSIFTLAAIAADRYFIVVNPIDQRITKEKAKKIIGLIWCVAVTAAAPAILALKVNMVPDVIDIQDYSSDDFNDFLVSNYTLLASNFSLPVKPQCENMGMDPDLWRWYNRSLVVIQYFVPVTILLVTYGRIGLRLRGAGKRREVRPQGSVARKKSDQMRRATLNSESTDKTHWTSVKSSGQDTSHSPPRTHTIPLSESAEQIANSKRKVLKTLIIIVALFALCWLPLQTYNFLQDFFPEINEFKYINVIWFVCHFLAMSNSCVNPFVYAIYTLN